MSNTVLQPGQYVTPNLQLVRLLGEGGMGSVWVANHRTLRSEVAVKFMAIGLAMDRSAAARFSREASATAQIRSPHVVQTYDHGVTSFGLPFIVMELLEGEDLRTRIKRLGGIGIQDTAKIVQQACKALTRAHAAGIVHRDIKPDNIFLMTSEDDIFVKILDFGIAKKDRNTKSMRMTATGAMIGTPYYMSPEQMMNAKSVDARADLWSLGVVVYHCLTGRVPFNGETIGGLCVSIEKAVYTPASQVNIQLPMAIDNWFARVLVREPENRFKSAKEMADAFTSVAANWDASGASRPDLPIAVAAVSQAHDSVPGTGFEVSAAPAGITQGPTLTGASVSSTRLGESTNKSNIGVMIALFSIAFAILVVGIGAIFYLQPQSTDVAEDVTEDVAEDVAEAHSAPEMEALSAAPSSTGSAPEVTVASASAPSPTETPPAQTSTASPLAKPPGAAKATSKPPLAGKAPPSPKLADPRASRPRHPDRGF